MPVCVVDHRRCHGEVVIGCPPIPEEDQRLAVIETKARFIELATPEEWELVGRDRARWLASRVVAW